MQIRQVVLDGLAVEKRTIKTIRAYDLVVMQSSINLEAWFWNFQQYNYQPVFLS